MLHKSGPGYGLCVFFCGLSFSIFHSIYKAPRPAHCVTRGLASRIGGFHPGFTLDYDREKSHVCIRTVVNKPTCEAFMLFHPCLTNKQQARFGQCKPGSVDQSHIKMQNSYQILMSTIYPQGTQECL